MSYRPKKGRVSRSSRRDSSRKNSSADLESIQDASSAAEYIQGMIEPLLKLAERNELEVLFYLLRMAEEEAALVKTTGKGRK